MPNVTYELTVPNVNLSPNALELNDLLRANTSDPFTDVAVFEDKSNLRELLDGLRKCRPDELYITTKFDGEVVWEDSGDNWLADELRGNLMTDMMLTYSP